MVQPPRPANGVSLALAACALIVVAACCATRAVGAAESAAASPSFKRDVMAVLSRAGCNQGACHGNLNGKGGLSLSLRGQSPADDLRALVREHGGRRVDSARPEVSLLLLKATGRAPHQGGVRFKKTDQEYSLLRDWIAAGCPADPPSLPEVASLAVTPVESVISEPHDSVALRVIAHFTDGSQRDVTPLATFEVSNLAVRVDREGVVQREQYGESTVVVRYLHLQTPARVAFVPERSEWDVSEFPAANAIDHFWRERWQALRVRPAALADDATLARRSSLDLLGVLPTAEEAQEFVEDQSVDKWQRWIDRTLARPEFADRWALAWSDLLRVEEKVLDTKGVERFHGWIREGFNRDKPLDQFVRELLTAQGSTYESPPANFYRSLRDPVARGETVGRLFLGVRLQCAQCHNHPFDRWTQDDFYQWMALFARVDYQIVENNRKDKLDKHEFVGDQIVKVLDVGEVVNPRTGQDAVPRFLGEATPEMEPNSDRREPLADWLAASSNQRFARTQANFLWFQVMGRGLVEPVDDLRSTNPAAHPALLEFLADDLARRRFDIRGLVRELVLSRLYRLDSTPNDTNVADDSLFARAIVRRLPAEALLDAQSQVLDEPLQFSGYDRLLRAGQLPGVRRSRDKDRKATEGDRLLSTFGKPQRLLACACERSEETTLKQAMALIGGQELQERLESSLGRVERWANWDSTADSLVDDMYWTTLTRSPTADERRQAAQWLAAGSERPIAVRDLTWALLNAKEFLFRH